MSIKNLLLCSLLICNAVVADQKINDISNFISNVPKLNSIEQQKLMKYLQESNNNFEDLSKEEKDAALNNIVLRSIALSEKYSNFIKSFEDISQNCENNDIKLFITKIKPLLKNFLNHIKEDKELTNLSKNLVDFACKQLIAFLDKISNNLNLCDYIKQGNCTSQEEDLIIKLLNDYLPTHIDIVQISLDHSIYSYEYLAKQLASRGSLTIDDLSHVFIQYGIALKLPKASQIILNDFMIAFCAGVKDLPQNVSNDLLKPIEEIISKPELAPGFKLLSAMSKLRKNIVSSNGADKEKLMGYSKLIDQIIAQITKSQNTKSQNKNYRAHYIAILEKLIFKI